MCVAEEHWRTKPRLQSIPIYFYSKLANESLKVFQVWRRRRRHILCVWLLWVLAGLRLTVVFARVWYDGVSRVPSRHTCSL